MSKIERIKEIFTELKKAHFYWTKGTLDYKDRLERAIEPTIKELESLGVARRFSEALLFFGKEFVDSEVKELSKSAKATLGKTVLMNDKEKRELLLAEKHGAKVYESIPVKGGKVGIKVLSYK